MGQGLGTWSKQSMSLAIGSKAFKGEDDDIRSK